MSRHIAMALLGLAALAVAAQAQQMYPGVAGSRFRGYTYASGVVGYTNMSADMCNIQTALMAGRPADALAVYLNGNNSISGSALRRFRTWATSAHPGEQTYDLLIAYHSPDNTTNVAYLDNLIQGFFTAGRTARAVSLNFYVTVFKYMMHEYDVGIARITAGLNDSNTGAPHAIDEGVALWAGGSPAGCISPYQNAETVSREMRTAHVGQSPVNLALAQITSDLLYIGMKGNASDNVQQALQLRTSLHVNLAVYHAQAVLREVYGSEIGSLCHKNNVRDDCADKAASAWDALAPVLRQNGASLGILRRVTETLANGSPKYTVVAKYLQAAWEDAKLPRVMLGTPNFSAINTNPSCKRKPAGGR